MRAALPSFCVREQERRRHQRVNISLPGRFMREDRAEFSCVTIDISPGGVALSSQGRVAVGERIVAYLRQVGRLEGCVAREFIAGFAIQLKLPPVKRDKLADQLTWLANRHALGLLEDRRHERVAPRGQATTLKLSTGGQFAARIMDVSISGAALTVDVAPPIGTPVTVGATPAHVVRHFSGGIAVEFARLILAETFDAFVVL
jgi:c-di-GMP-binding flagellar brake protein YcgR